jgi:hypothetical protein
VNTSICEEADVTSAGHGIDFIYNQHFRCLAGHEFFKNGEVCFPEEALVKRAKGQLRCDGSYRTIFGPSVLHNGVIYENSNNNVRLAMRRMTAVRKGDLAEDTRLSRNQVVFFHTHMHVVDKLRNCYSKYFDDYKGMITEADEHHGDVHPKRALRVHAWNTLLKGERHHIGDHLWLRDVLYKMKKQEWAKHGKVPRMIGDLGVSASLQGFRVTKFLKEAMSSEPFLYAGGTIYFCMKPTFDDLSYVFSELLYPTRRFFFVYFSDDACYAINTKDGVFRANLDISACDASHGPAVFGAYPHLVDGVPREDLTVLVEQCMLPIRVYDLANPKSYVKLQPLVPKLYSGSTITTSINNFANIMIAVSIGECCADNETTIIAAAAAAGYIITVEACEVFEDIQFLKHSPTLDIHGIWRPLLNPGVLLRLSGVAKGDLPGTGDIKTRGRKFQSALLQGTYPLASFPLINQMRCTAGETDAASMRAVNRQLAHSHFGLEKETFHYHAQDVYRRYRLTVAQSEHLDTTFGRATQGEQFSSEAVDLILKKDYGLRTLNNLD